MASAKMEFQGRTLEIEQERVEVSTALPQPDPKWTYTDHAGHQHAYGTSGSVTDRYPTLVLRESEPYWCSDCQDEHTDTWLECPLCGEKITPGTYIDTSPKYLPGLTSYLIDGQPVSKEEGDALFAQMRAEREQEQRARTLKDAKARAQHAEQAMREEGLPDEQIQRVVNRMVYGTPEGEQS